MLTVILSASIPAASLIIVQIIISMKQQRVQDVRLDMTVQEIKSDLSRLEKKQDRHNNLIERVYDIQRTLERHDERIKVANHRIDDLENK